MKTLFSKNKLVKTVGIAAAALTISVVTIVSTVSAQEPTDKGQRQFGRHGHGGNSELHTYIQDQDIRSQMQAALAEVLGLTVEDLEAAKANGESIRDLAEQQGVELNTIREAKSAVMEGILVQAVADGIITQDQADQMAERGSRGFGGPRGHRGGKGFGNLVDRDAVKAALAEVLGLTVEDLEAAKANGESIRDLAEQQGVDLSDLQEARNTIAITAIEQAVEDGTLTQEQASQMLERIENGDFHNGPRGHRGKGEGNPIPQNFRGPRNGNGPAISDSTL